MCCGGTIEQEKHKRVIFQAGIKTWADICLDDSDDDHVHHLDRVQEMNN